MLFDQRSPLSGLFAIGNVNNLAEFKEAASLLIHAAKQHPDWPVIQQTIKTVAHYYLQQNATTTNIDPIDFEEVSTVKWLDRELAETEQRVRKEALKEGREEGIEKGAEMTKLEMARRLLLEGGFSLEWIAKLTGLSLKQVEQLKPQTN